MENTNKSAKGYFRHQSSRMFSDTPELRKARLYRQQPLQQALRLTGCRACSGVDVCACDYS